MNETFERIKSFIHDLQENHPMVTGEGAVIILALDKKDMPEDECRTVGYFVGIREQVENLIFQTLLKEPTMRNVLMNAMRAHLYEHAQGQGIRRDAGR